MMLRGCPSPRTFSVLLALAGMCAGCERIHTRHVELAFAERANASAPDAGSLSGFTCSTNGLGDAGGVPLVRRAVRPLGAGEGSLGLSLAVQAFALDDNPGCRDTKLYNYCGLGQGGCSLLPDSTFCVELEGEPLPASTVSRSARLHAALAALLTAPEAEGGLSGALYGGAPRDQWVLLRAVGTTEPCSEVLPSGHVFDPARLIGCAFTCPVVLSSWSGKLWLDSSAGGRCEAQVAACAGETFSPIALDVE
jgi:hypothetical protein